MFIGELITSADTRGGGMNKEKCIIYCERRGKLAQEIVNEIRQDIYFTTRLKPKIGLPP